VIALPTIRTVGIDKPILSPLVRDYMTMRKFGLSQNHAVRQYEERMANYKEMFNKLSQTTEPTYLIGQPICGHHKQSYNLNNWIKESEWEYLREAARHYGFEIKESRFIIVQFKPLGWKPGSSKIELVRW